MEAQRVSIAAVTRSLHVWFIKISTPLYNFYGNNSKRNPEDTTDVNISSETCREMQTAAWSENVEAITGVCSGKEQGDVQSLSTRDPMVEEIIFMCVL